MARTTRELRLRRHARVRRKLSGTAARPRVAVSRTNKHISAQIIDDVAGRTLAAASSVEPALKGVTGGNIAGATAVANLLAERARARGLHVQHVPSGAIVGVGTGSTVNKFIDALASIKNQIRGAVSSSVASTERLKALAAPRLGSGRLWLEDGKVCSEQGSLPIGEAVRLSNDARDGVLTTDALGRVTWLNPVAQRLTGWAGAEALGQPIGDHALQHAIGKGRDDQQQHQRHRDEDRHVTPAGAETGGHASGTRRNAIGS